ncbi:GNAT family N-acetyltransferase [Pseudomonas sp. NFXW11]|uniref:GNAT family N-acetyltransferase n=1 Tax=Pseudomonas sp. NFXW11 TaxID=2819531 RepID=UPI003CECB5D8
MLSSERLIMRPWQASDAPSLYRYASDPRVGPRAGWPVHRNVAQSLEIIHSVFAHPEVYAVTHRDEGVAIGMVGLLQGRDSNFSIADDEAEVAYWIGVPYWGLGLIPEAVQALMQHAFHTLQLKALWCGYYSDNQQSFRAQAKCGFQYHHTEENKFNPLMNDYRTEHISRIGYQQWLQGQGRAHS